MDEYPLHTGFMGFKLYTPTQSCCEICTRLAPYCRYWATPALGIEKPSFTTNGCELFFEKDTPEDFIPLSHLIRTPSPENSNSTAASRSRRRTVRKVFTDRLIPTQHRTFWVVVGVIGSRWTFLAYPVTWMTEFTSHKARSFSHHHRRLLLLLWKDEKPRCSHYVRLITKVSRSRTGVGFGSHGPGQKSARQLWRSTRTFKRPLKS
jgi:hypothetical protein